MPSYTQGLTIFQSGRETTKGTAVAATSKFAVEGMVIRPIDSIVRPKIIKGVLLANPGNELAVQRGMEWEFSNTPLIYDQLQQFLAMTYKGAVAPSAGPPYTWTYTRDPLADPALDSRTFEMRQTDGTTPNDVEFAYGMCQSLEISGAENEPLRMAAKGFGRRIQSSTLTAAQALPTVVIPPMALSSVYIDPTWATRGTTLVSGQVLGWKYRIESGVKPLMTADARSDLDFTVDVIDWNDVKLSLELVILATASGQWATEKTAAEALTLRAVEVRAVVSANASLKLRGLFRHTAGSVFPADVQDGQRICTLSLEGSTDDTNFAEAILINTAAALG